jgi:hypothetical protein
MCSIGLGSRLNLVVKVNDKTNFKTLDEAQKASQSRTGEESIVQNKDGTYSLVVNKFNSLEEAQETAKLKDGNEAIARNDDGSYSIHNITDNPNQEKQVIDMAKKGETSTFNPKVVEFSLSGLWNTSVKVENSVGEKDFMSEAGSEIRGAYLSASKTGKNEFATEADAIEAAKQHSGIEAVVKNQDSNGNVVYKLYRATEEDIEKLKNNPDYKGKITAFVVPPTVKLPFFTDNVIKIPVGSPKATSETKETSTTNTTSGTSSSTSTSPTSETQDVSTAAPDPFMGPIYGPYSPYDPFNSFNLLSFPDFENSDYSDIAQNTSVDVSSNIPETSNSSLTQEVKEPFSTKSPLTLGSNIGNTSTFGLNTNLNPSLGFNNTPKIGLNSSLSPSLGFNSSLSSSSFGLNSNLSPSFGFNNSFASSSFGLNSNLLSPSFGFNNSLASSSFGLNSNLLSPSFGFNNSLASSSYHNDYGLAGFYTSEKFNTDSILGGGEQKLTNVKDDLAKEEYGKTIDDISKNTQANQEILNQKATNASTNVSNTIKESEDTLKLLSNTDVKTNSLPKDIKQYAVNDDKTPMTDTQFKEFINNALDKVKNGKPLSPKELLLLSHTSSEIIKNNKNLDPNIKGKLESLVSNGKALMIEMSKFDQISKANSSLIKELEERLQYLNPDSQEATEVRQQIADLKEENETYDPNNDEGPSVAATKTVNSETSRITTQIAQKSHNEAKRDIDIAMSILNDPTLSADEKLLQIAQRFADNGRLMSLAQRGLSSDEMISTMLSRFQSLKDGLESRGEDSHNNDVQEHNNNTDVIRSRTSEIEASRKRDQVYEELDIKSIIADRIGNDKCPLGQMMAAFSVLSSFSESDAPQAPIIEETDKTEEKQITQESVTSDKIVANEKRITELEEELANADQIDISSANIIGLLKKFREIIMTLDVDSNKIKQSVSKRTGIDRKFSDSLKENRDRWDKLDLAKQEYLKHFNSSSEVQKPILSNSIRDNK